MMMYMFSRSYYTLVLEVTIIAISRDLQDIYLCIRYTHFCVLYYKTLQSIHMRGVVQIIAIIHAYMYSADSGHKINCTGRLKTLLFRDHETCIL